MPYEDAVRQQQVYALYEWLDQRSSADSSKHVIIIAGDFNATPESASVLLLRSRWCSAYATVHGDEPAWTFGTPLAVRNNVIRGKPPCRGTVDYIFASPDTVVVDAQLVCDRSAPADPHLFASDHVGVYAEFKLT
ncbi:MAG: hypothetical protein GFH27_549349n94 [Chloroflexi bacterium AL-W]|nr:hypothetical protein [Chloroflexi bacterium AL-N1]NOK69992.1 hypothetical protein [Chloroflexi bacterium AL-N10]NOK73710.1 hypothetical protein [Chloroflexi bacterium AL-N5]NOK85524.1 hypothetical protein [Chloroflexi bacterium AL-W]NOK91725.1 hypothetical protein [Chloroflexi bacterium AL-N15]